MAYRKGDLRVEPGKVSLWKGGKMKRGLGEDVDTKNFSELVEEWNKEDPKGTPWVEDVSLQFVYHPFISRTSIPGLGLTASLARTSQRRWLNIPYIHPPYNTHHQHKVGHV